MRIFLIITLLISFNACVSIKKYNLLEEEAGRKKKRIEKLNVKLNELNRSRTFLKDSINKYSQ